MTNCFEDIADIPVSDNEDFPVSALQVSTDVGVPGLSIVHSNILDSRVSQGDTEWLCLLYSASSGNVRDDTIAIRLNDGGLDHWRGVVWDPGIVGQQCVHVCGLRGLYGLELSSGIAEQLPGN